MRNASWILAIAAVCVGLTTPASGADGRQVRATGWFADEKCAMARAKSGTFAPTNTECALRCLKKGAKLVFIAEQQKAIWSVARPKGYVAHVGEYVEIAGVLAEGSEKLQIESLKTIDKVRPSCGLDPRNAHY
jgi:hypothetical protein